MNYLPLLILGVVLALAMSMTRRSRRNAQLQATQREDISFGTEVMTSSGLYGTVVGRNDDGTVQLAIAPGVEVKWAIAALRDISSLPTPDRPAGAPPTDSPPDSTGS